VAKETDGQQKKDPELTFNRALRDEFEKLLLESEPLLRLLRSPGQLNVKHQPPVTFDTQLRRGDVVSICAGLTKVLDLRYLRNGCFSASADPAYQRQNCAVQFEVFKGFTRAQLEAKVAAWATYLGKVQVGERQYRKEGAWQAWLAHRAFLGISQPWVLADREAELEGLVGDHLAAVAKARKDIAAAVLRDPLFGKRQNPINEDRGGGADFVGVTPDGNLALIEVKHGGNGGPCYCTPIQIGGYAALWSRALGAPKAYENVVKPIQKLLEQKRRLGLLPDGPGLSDAPRLDPSVVIAEPNLRSTVWRGPRLLARVWAAARGTNTEWAPRTRFFVCDANRFELREVTTELAEGRDVKPA